VDRETAERLLAVARKAQMAGADAADWVQRLTPMRQELGDAVNFLVQTGEVEESLEIVSRLWRLWLLNGDIEGGRRVLSSALDAGERRPTRARSLALYGIGVLDFRAGEMAESKNRNEEGLRVARAIGDREAEALALVGLSRVALRDRDYARVRSLASQARDLTMGLEPAAGVWPLHLLATGTRLAGEYDEARRLYSESLELNRRLGDSGIVGMELFNLGFVELHRGNREEGERRFSESAAIRRPDGPYDTAMTLLSQAAVAVARDQREKASELLDSATATLGAAGIVLDPDDAVEVDWLRERLGRPA